MPIKRNSQRQQRICLSGWLCQQALSHRKAGYCTEVYPAHLRSNTVTDSQPSIPWHQFQSSKIHVDVSSKTGWKSGEESYALTRVLFHVMLDLDTSVPGRKNYQESLTDSQSRPPLSQVSPWSGTVLRQRSLSVCPCDCSAKVRGQGHN